MLHKHKISSLFACVLFVSSSITGCATATHSVHFSKSELQLIPDISLQRIASSHASDEIITIRVDGYAGPVEVKEFKNNGLTTVYGTDGNEAEIKFSDITELLIFKKPKTPVQTDRQKVANASTIVSAAAETLAYTPIVPLAIGTWPLLRAMGLDGSKNSADSAKARRIYHGMSRQELLASVGLPIEKYSCILKLHLKDKPDVAQEIWIYHDSKVLRGGRALFIDRETGTVSHNSFHTTFFKGSEAFTCSPLAVP